LHDGAPRFFVFDLDGTLVDSRRDIADSANRVLEDCGCRPHSEDAIGAMVGDGAAMLMRRAFRAADCAPPADALERFLSVYNGRLLRHTRAYDGVPELLDRLAARAPLAVLTNKPLDATREILNGLDLARFFDGRVLGGDGPHPRKPDPAGLRQLMTRAGAEPPSTLMVGDSVIDLRTARAAGARACIARYGFGYHPDPDDLPMSSDLFLDRALDLLEIL
jgi:phosphoglycolate phosphatase